MKTTTDILKSILSESHIPDSLIKKAKPFTVGKTSGHRIAINNSNEGEIKQQIHNHLTANGYKRDMSISDRKSHTYVHSNGDKVHVTHMDKSVTVETTRK